MARAATQAVREINTGKAAYSDGHPLDAIQYLEAKLILKPDRFTSVDCFRDFGNAFILRRRISYVDGFPVGDPEIVFKFRHPDEQKAAAVDVRPNIAGKHRIKFKTEVLPLKDEIGGYRLLHSHNCVFGLSQVHRPDRTAMATLCRVFSAMGTLGIGVPGFCRIVDFGVFHYRHQRMDAAPGGLPDLAQWFLRSDQFLGPVG